AGQLAPIGPADTIVRGLPTGGHLSRNIALDTAGNLFVNVGSASNVCEGATHDPCGELTTRAGIWRFSASQTGQTFSSAARFATGLRNSVAMAVNRVDGRLYAVPHGRDNLYQSYPALFNAQDGADNPGEEIAIVS